MAGRACAGTPSCISSRCRVPATNRRYKTLENFLRRLAFNLGNSVSQTDVKILSCIPIDVTDLQQRIQELEKELENSNGGENGKDKKKKKKKDDDTKGDDAKDGDKKDDAAKDDKDKKSDGKATVVQMMHADKKTSNHKGFEPRAEKDVKSLFKASNRDKRITKTRYITMHSTSNTDASIHNYMYRNKDYKTSPFTVMLGSMKKKPVIHNPEKYEMVCGFNSASSYSIALPTSRVRVNMRNKDSIPAFENYCKPKKKPRSKERTCFEPRNQYVYYAQTSSVLKEKENTTCDMSYIANLIQKQYSPTTMLTQNNNFTRNIVSEHNCNYRRDTARYPVSGQGPCSCCHEGTSDFNIRSSCNLPMCIDQINHTRLFQTKNSGKFYDCSQYDMIPVKQQATKNNHTSAYDIFPQKCGKGFQSPNIIPPFNLSPTLRYDALRDDANQEFVYGSDGQSSSQQPLKEHQLRNHRRKYRMNHKKTMLDPEDIFMTDRIRENKSDSNYGDTKASEAKSNEIMEVKAILKDLIKEIKEEHPKSYQPIANGGNQILNPCTFMPNFSPMVPATQCCPILCPINFVPEGYTNPSTVSSTKSKKSDCSSNQAGDSINDKEYTNSSSNDGLSETKKLIEEIYKSVSMQNEDKVCKVHHDVIQEVPEEEVPDGKEDFSSSPIDQNQSERTIDMDRIVVQPPDIRTQSSLTHEHYSCDHSLTFTNNNTTNHTTTTAHYARGHHDVGTYSQDFKKSKFFTLKNALKLLGFTKNHHRHNTHIMNRQAKYDQSPFRRNELNYSLRCEHDRDGLQMSSQLSSPVRGGCCRSPMLSSAITTTDDTDNDYFNRTLRNRTCPMKSTLCSCCDRSPSPVCGFGETLARKCSPNSCYFMSDPHQIPFCLREIEVKNVGTQSEKKNKLFAILKKVKASDESSHSPDAYSSTVMSSRVQMPPPKSKGQCFLDFLKGDVDMSYKAINKYNLIDTEEAKLGFTKDNFLPKFKTKKKGMWGTYVDTAKKEKKRDDLRRQMEEPFKFKSVMLRTLMGQKPRPNLKVAKPFL